MKNLFLICSAILMTGCSTIPSVAGSSNVSGRPSSDWRFIMGTGDYNVSRHYIKTDSIHVEANGIRTAYVMTVYENPKILNDNTRYIAYVSKTAFNCSDWNAQKSIAGVALNAPIYSGEHVVGKFKNSETEWDYTRENSLGDKKWKFVCEQ